eukprot:3933675-Rhodomonas_salina.1
MKDNITANTAYCTLKHIPPDSSANSLNGSKSCSGSVVPGIEVLSSTITVSGIVGSGVVVGSGSAVVGSGSAVVGSGSGSA